MAQTAAAVSGLGRKRVARVLVRCFCKASLDCREGGGGHTVRWQERWRNHKGMLLSKHSQVIQE